MSRSVDWFKVIAEYMKKTKYFEQHIKKVKPIYMSNGKYKAEFVVTENDLNENGRFHEGLTATLVDVLSFHALLSHGKGYSGVSSNIHISYLQPAFLGDILSLDAEVFRIENPLAFVEVQVSKKNGDEIVARGQHTLFVKPLPDPKPVDENDLDYKNYIEYTDHSKKR